MSNTCIKATIIKKPITVTIKKQDSVVVKLIQRGLKGEKGDAGADGTNTTDIYTAGEALSALKIVRIASADGKLYLTDGTDVTQYQSIVGMTQGAVSAGANPNILFQGPHTDSNWNWNMSGDVSLYLGAGGQITQTPLTSGFSLRVGFATSPQSIFLHQGEPIILT